MHKSYLESGTIFQWQPGIDRLKRGCLGKREVPFEGIPLQVGKKDVKVKTHDSFSVLSFVINRHKNFVDNCPKKTFISQQIFSTFSLTVFFMCYLWGDRIQYWDIKSRCE